MLRQRETCFAVPRAQPPRLALGKLGQFAKGLVGLKRLNIDAAEAGVDELADPPEQLGLGRGRGLWGQPRAPDA